MCESILKGGSCRQTLTAAFRCRLHHHWTKWAAQITLLFLSPAAFRWTCRRYLLLMLSNERPKWSYYSSSHSSCYTSGRNTRQNGDPDCSGSSSPHYSTCLAFSRYMQTSLLPLLVSYWTFSLSGFSFHSFFVTLSLLKGMKSRGTGTEKRKSAIFG